MADARKIGSIVFDKLREGFNANVKSDPALIFLLFFSFFIHLWDVLNNFRDFGPRLMWYIIILVIAWLTVFRKEVGVIDIADLKIPVILSSIAVIVPYLGNALPFLNNSQIFQTLIIFFPVWVIYFAFSIGRNQLYIKILRWGIIIFWIVLLVPILTTNFAADLHLSDVETGINVQQTIANAGRDFSAGVKNIGSNLGKVFRDTWNNIIKIGAGDYYTGKVDEYENEPIGVYLEDLEASDPKFFEGEKITVWAVLKARTLEDNIIKIIVSCYAKEGDKEIAGSIIPQNEFNIATEEEEYLDCTFDKLNPGKMDVTFNAEFNFETMAYLQTYFMDKDRLRAFKREGIDVFEHYKISHRDPITIYTNGPVGIGMKATESLPIGVYSDEENIPFFFGITIENKWEGTIKEVTGLEVQVHDSLELTNCDQDFEFKENKDGYNVYIFTYDEQTRDPWWQRIAGYHTIQCRLNPVDPRSLLGSEPITTRYFRVTASYIYELEKSVPVEIEEVKDYVSPEEEVMTSDEQAQEFKDKLSERTDGKTNKEIACSEISKCSDYDANYYDKLGFSDQTWCDDDPCELDCYSSFKKSDDEVYYDSCKGCPYYTTIQGMPSEDYCNIYLAEDYCEKDLCNLKSEGIDCNWYDGNCVMSITPPTEEKYFLIEQGCELTKEERIEKVKDIVDETNTFIPREIVLGVAQQENGFDHCDSNNNVIIGDDNEIGLMQISPSTAKEFCKGITENQLKDIDLNIMCGIEVLEGKYIRYVSSGLYETSVNSICKKSEHPEENALYLSYMDNEWDMTLRAYNGFGCQNEKVAGYVENVRDKIEEYGFD